MKNTQYNNAFKTVAVLLQMVCLIVVIVIFSLLANLFGRSMLRFSDVGSDSFFDSDYYAETLAEETVTLTTYLQMQMGIRQSEQDSTKYKQYKMKFDRDNTNLFYWFLYGENVYTNMEGEPSLEEAVKYARGLGSYLYYDDSTISFEGNIRRTGQFVDRSILRLFQQGRQSGSLVIGVDTSLAKDDEIAEAAKIYNTCFPWVEAGVFIAIIAMMCFVLLMIYITLATGRNEEDDNIRLYRMDYLPTEILFIVFIIFVTSLITFCARLSNQKWEISSALILTGTLVFVSDGVLLTLYLSFVRKIKADIFFSCSLSSLAVRTVKEGMQKQRITRRAVMIYTGGTLLELFFAWEAFAKRNMWAFTGLILIVLWMGIRIFQNAVQRKKILEGILEITSGKLNYQLDEREFTGDYKEMAEKINSIGEGLSNAVEENLKSERLKTELITNVSHDIKTPLTSIINYVNLIKLENVQNEKVENYVNILEKKSLRLKQLTEDLVEVSKISSGNITLDMQPINMVELIYQTGGEFNEIFENMGLTIITRLPREPVIISADGNRIWRIVQNLYNNVAKYALKDTRVYVELKVTEGEAKFSIKDISAQELDKIPQDLSERFVRGDDSRGTEGSGLGLSIAKNLTIMMGGTFEIGLDGDLFTASITFPVINP